ncbi:MAG: LysM peptidoglycan-binding domain-containing protein [Gammaproteobacteria bacterium]|nr:LysM peptidoglycan-binding domain-containing protein [Gammaproteobacteria bacterium]
MPELKFQASRMSPGKRRGPTRLLVALGGATLLLGACLTPERDRTDSTADIYEPVLEASASVSTQQEQTSAVSPAVVVVDSSPEETPESIMIASADMHQLESVFSGPANLLDRIRAGYQLGSNTGHSVQARKRVAQQFDWYRRHPDYMNRVFRRSEPYLFHIVESIEARGMPGELALLPIVESAFDPFAYSHGRAAGLWQFIPATGRRFGLKQNWWYDGRRDVTEATRAALDYLETLAGMFDGDYLLAVAAYNSGEGVVRRAIRRNQRAGQPTDFWHLRLPPETRAYVPKLLALRELVRIPEEYGLELPVVADRAYFSQVATEGQIDLALAADLAGIDLDTLYSLNPGFNRWATDPDGPHRLLVPVENAAMLTEALQSLPPAQRVRWERHTIKSGDNLGALARRYGTTIALIKDVNNLRSNNIRVGDDLMIPRSRKSLESYSKSEAVRLARLKKASRGRSKTTYVVRSGDSFWDIARRHGVQVRQLASWNGMAPRDTLSVGRELVIWDAKGQSTNVATASPPADRTLRRISYTVRSGDSFARISGRFRVSVAQLQKWNKAAARQKYLRPGQKLTLYVDVTRQTG